MFTRKAVVVCLVIIAVSQISLFAQIPAGRELSPEMKYRDYKNLYDPHTWIPYSDDVYKTGVVGVASALIPGVGQMIEGEFWRGAPFLLGNLACLYLMGSSMYYFVPVEDNSTASDRHALGGAIFFGAMAVDIGLRIWSCSDAVKVAKIKNLYYRDLRKKYQPSVSLVPDVGAVRVVGFNQMYGGLALSMSF